MNAQSGPLVVAGASVVLSIGSALALISPALEEAVLQTAKAARETARVTPEFRQKGWDFWTIEIENIAMELHAERARVKKQMEAIEQRMARLTAEEKEFERARGEVDQMRAQLTDRIVEIQAEETKNIRSLAASYAKLTPRAAVAIFREMDDVTIVKILASMKPDQVGPIFEEMSRTGTIDDSLAKRAAVLSEKLRLTKAARSAP